MKTLGAKAFWVVIRIFFFFLEEFFKRMKSKDEVHKKIICGKFKVKKVKIKGAVSENVVWVAISPRSP